jgi:hypothetical protein
MLTEYDQLNDVAAKVERRAAKGRRGANRQQQKINE